MIQTLGWRLAQAGMVAFLVAILSFLMMQALPGDMVFRIAAARFGYDNVSAENAELVRTQIGDPAGVDAFLSWILGLLQGDLGSSLVSGEKVSAEILHQFGATAQLAGLAILLSLLIGPTFGILAGMRPQGWMDRLTLLFASSLKATPQFLLGLFLIVLLSIELGLLPSAGYGKPSHLVLPSLTLALGLSASTARITREALVQGPGLGLVALCSLEGARRKRGSGPPWPAAYRSACAHTCCRAIRRSHGRRGGG